LLLHAMLRHRAAATLAMHQWIDISYPPGAQQQTRRTLLQLAKRTDRGTPYRSIDTASHTMRALPTKRRGYCGQ